jgi:hypothetical protein
MTIRGEGNKDEKMEDVLYSPDEEEVKRIAKEVVKEIPNLKRWDLFKKIDGGTR